MNPWLFMIPVGIFWILAAAFVLPAQGYPNGLKVSPRFAAWATFIFAFLSLGSLGFFLWAIMVF